MIHQDIYNSFTSASETKNWSALCNNGYDCCILSIPAGKKNNVRQNFGISHQEEILFFRDTSFWNSENQGLVLTDNALYCIPDNDDPESRFVFTWEIIKTVKYLDGCLYFYGYEGDDDVCPINMGYFLKDTSSDYLVNDYGKSIAHLLSRIAAKIKHVDPFEENEKNVNGLVEKGNLDGAISLLKSIISQDDGTYKAYWYYRLSCIVRQKDGVEVEEQSAKYCMEGLNYCEDGSPISIWLRNQHRSVSVYPYLLEVDKLDSGEPVTSLQNTKLQRWEGLWVSQNATDQTYSDGTLMKDDAARDYEDANRFYCENFIRQPYNERKVLLVVDEYTDLRQDSLCVMRKSDIPSNMSFPIGHPQVGQIYVGHPFIPAKYVPFEEYQLEFIEDKVREFTWLMQCMGATKISISAKNDNEQNGDYSSNQNISGNTSYGLAKANGSYSRNSKGSFAEQISKAISLNQEFNPKRAPFVPEGLVWYQNEPSWQRLVNQRMTGSLVHASESIESRKSNMVNGSELTNIKAEFHSLVSLDGEWTKEEEAKFQQQENATLTFEIDFAPVESLTKDANSSSSMRDYSSLENAPAKKDENEIAQSIVFSMKIDDYYSVQSRGKTGVAIVGYVNEGSVKVGDTIRLVDHYRGDDLSLSAKVEECIFEELSIESVEKGDDAKLILTGVKLKEMRHHMKAIIVKSDSSHVSEESHTASMKNATNNDQDGLSTKEQDYLEEVLSMLADGEIGPRERKTLDRFASRLGITPERAEELEASLSVPALTDDEKEYLEEVKLTLEDGEIGPRERKFLDRCASRLGISPDKAKEIESYAANF
ncbi:MAG: hypothetical protein MJZ04_00215 [Bacteroidales bacterium]|nr:hypothetical protein [Bacteroidales bacterium]